MNFKTVVSKKDISKYSKLQLIDSLSFYSEMKGFKISNFDDDNYMDAIIIYKDKFEIYEDYNGKFIKINDSSDMELEIELSGAIALGDTNGNGKNELILGGEKGDIYIINTSQGLEQYSSLYNITYYDYYYDNKQYEYFPSLKPITDIITGDIDNDGTKEIIFGNNRAAFFAFNYSNSNYENLTTNHANPGITWKLGGDNNNTINCITAIDPTDSELFTLLICTDEDLVYVSTYNGTENNIFTKPDKVDILDYRAKDLKILNRTGAANYELIAGTINGKILIYTLGNNYSDKNDYNVIWNSEDLVASGNQVRKITIGDFKQANTNLIAIGTTLDIKKVMVLDSDFDLYWDTDIYIREDIVDLMPVNKPGIDNLAIGSSTHLYIFSENFKDEDEDGLSDLGETVFYDTDPDDEDTDADGLGDGHEILIWKTDPNNPDTDGDLIPDGMEVLMGTDPLDPLDSIIIRVSFPALIIVGTILSLIAVRKNVKSRREEYNEVKSIPNIIPQVRRLIIQRLENYTNSFKGFGSKIELTKFKKYLSLHIKSIVLDRFFNFLEYLRLKGIVLTDRQEELLKKIVTMISRTVVKKTDTLIKTLLKSEIKYKEFKVEYIKVLGTFSDWKKPIKGGTELIEDLVKCPKCTTLNPQGSAFCIECGNKLV